MNKPKISIILTSYNHAKYIEETIDNILNQTYKDFELIIVDDNSSDQSWKIIQSYSDDRIISFQTDNENTIVSGMIKSITQIAKGKYIAIHHSDDIWESTKLEEQFLFLEENNEIGAVFTDAQPIDELSNLFEDKNHFYYSIFTQKNRTRYEWLNYFFHKGNALCHPSVLVRKSVYEDCGVYQYGLAQLGDFDMWIRICMKYDIHVLSKKLVKFRIRDNQANSSSGKDDNRIRSLHEIHYIINNFKKLTNEELKLTFPEYIEHFKEDSYSLEYVLARIFIENKNNVYKLYGLDLLYKLLNNQKSSKILKKAYNFDYTKLIKLSGEIDSFNIIKSAHLKEDKKELNQKNKELNQKNEELNQKNEELNQKNEELNQKNEELNQKNKDYEDEVISLHLSKSWIMTRPLRKITRIIKNVKIFRFIS